MSLLTSSPPSPQRLSCAGAVSQGTEGLRTRVLDTAGSLYKTAEGAAAAVQQKLQRKTLPYRVGIHGPGWHLAWMLMMNPFSSPAGLIGAVEQGDRGPPGKGQEGRDALLGGSPTGKRPQGNVPQGQGAEHEPLVPRRSRRSRPSTAPPQPSGRACLSARFPPQPPRHSAATHCPLPR